MSDVLAHFDPSHVRNIMIVDLKCQKHGHNTVKLFNITWKCSSTSVGPIFETYNQSYINKKLLGNGFYLLGNCLTEISCSTEMQNEEGKTWWLKSLPTISSLLLQKSREI